MFPQRGRILMFHTIMFDIPGGRLRGLYSGRRADPGKLGNIVHIMACSRAGISHLEAPHEPCRALGGWGVVLDIGEDIFAQRLWGLPKCLAGPCGGNPSGNTS